jgi:hypothetical protein
MSLNIRKAFRICINRDDCEKFLDDSKWPEYVCISEWQFKPRKDGQNMTERQTKRSRDDLSPPDNTAPPRKQSAADDGDVESDMDEQTILLKSFSDPSMPNNSHYNDGDKH